MSTSVYIEQDMQLSHSVALKKGQENDSDIHGKLLRRLQYILTSSSDEVVMGPAR